MALQIRRGAEAQRSSIVPAEGELLYVTDTRQLYVGDGTQAGGRPVSASGGDINGPFTSTNNSIAVFDGTTGKQLRNSNVTVTSNGTITAPKVSNSIPFYYADTFSFPTASNVTGAVAFSAFDNRIYFAGKTRWIGILSAIAQDLNPTLSADLDIVNYIITTSETNGNITLAPNGTGSVNIVRGNLNLVGDISKSGTLNINADQLNLPSRISISETSFPANDNLLSSTILITQTHSTVQSIPITFKRSRGSFLGLASVANADELGSLRFDGYKTNAYVNGGKIAAVVDGIPGAGAMPTKFQFSTHNGSAVAVRAELSSGGILKVDQINSISTSQLTFNTALKLAVKSITALASGDVTLTAADITGNILICNPGADRNLTLPDATITSIVGLFAIIRNTSGSFSVTVKNSDGSTLTTVNASGVRGIYNDGTSWFSY
jgi:hypothetical protein